MRVLDGERGVVDHRRMRRRESLVVCPSCSCHVERSETSCPHCGGMIARDAGGSVQRTAAALLLGLTTSIAACEGPIAEPVYGVPSTGGGDPGGAGAGGTVSTSHGGGGHGGAPQGGQGGTAQGGQGGGGQGGAGGQGGTGGG